MGKVKSEIIDLFVKLADSISNWVIDLEGMLKTLSTKMTGEYNLITIKINKALNNYMRFFTRMVFLS